MKKKTKRFGLLLPSSNTTQEPEFAEVLPGDVSLHCARLTLRNIDPESTIKIVEELEAEAQKLKDAAVDAVVLSATAPSTRLGKGYDKKICARIEQACGKPATTAATAMLEAFTLLNIKKIVLAAPWGEGTNQTVAAFIEASGVQVLQQRAMGIVSNIEVGHLSAQTAYDLGRQADHPEADAIFLACGNWMTLEVIDALEKDTGKPVLSTNSCAIWATMNLIDGAWSIPGYGRLLANLRQG
jgi:maleate isomerase